MTFFSLSTDSTRMPKANHSFYLRNCYLENTLREPGTLTVAGQKVDFGTIMAPAFLYASKEDHIVPWTSAYASTQLLSGEVTFLLGASGHIAGVINPPAKNKRNYWVAGGEGGATDDAAAALPADPQEFFASAEKVPGSWWPNWYAWLAPKGGPQVAARTEAGSADFAPIEDAPGSYVKEKAS